MMRVYLSGITRNCLVVEGLDHVRLLVSYWDILNYHAWEVIDWARDRAIPMFLDSGAFSAMTRKESVSLADYQTFCLEHGNLFERIAYLDVIGDWRQSQRNYARSLQAGIQGIPTWHVGEPWEFLEDLLSEYAEVALGGLVPFLSAYSGVHRDKVLRTCVEAHRRARDHGVTLHGFGVTTWRLLSLLPWTSVDSSTWHTGRRFGMALIWTPNGLVCRRARDCRDQIMWTAKLLDIPIDNVDALIPGRRMRTEDYNPLLRYNAAVLLNAAAGLRRN